jgi:hypothetical protein
VVSVPSNELLVTLPRQSDLTVTGKAMLARSFPDPVNHIRERFRLRLEQIGVGGIQIMALGVTAPDSGFFTLYLLVRGDNVAFSVDTFPSADTGTSQQYGLQSAVSFGTDHVFDVVATLSAPPHLTVTVDGRGVVDEALPNYCQPGILNATAGVIYAQPTMIERVVGPLTMHVDDYFLEL